MRNGYRPENEKKRPSLFRGLDAFVLSMAGITHAIVGSTTRFHHHYEFNQIISITDS
jgi:hypothetical protein